MRLLNVETLKLEKFEKPPKYAILSHVWEEEEVLFHDIQQDAKHLAHLKGFSKIQGACNQADKDGLSFVWIDTCCIDKSSSAELSEAINSMFNWYRDSKVCYAYLSDVDITKRRNGSPRASTNAYKRYCTQDEIQAVVDGRLSSIVDDMPILQNPLVIETDFQLAESKWFTRGWTLQELLAPSTVILYDKHWRRLGSRRSLASRLSDITGIHESILTLNHPDGRHNPSPSPGGRCITCGARATAASILQINSVATRMSWAARRKTTREEDEAYCLMGLFDVNMPLLYGEGKKAFFRLQREIIASSNDQSILAHSKGQTLDISSVSLETNGFLASSPSQFRHKVSIGSLWSPLTLDDKGLDMEMLLCPCKLATSQRGSAPFVLGILECHATNDDLSRFAILLKPIDSPQKKYIRVTEYLLELSPNITSPLVYGQPSLDPFISNGLRPNMVWLQQEDYKTVCLGAIDESAARVSFDLARVQRKRVRLCDIQITCSLSIPSMPYYAVQSIVHPTTDEWVMRTFPSFETSIQPGIEIYIPSNVIILPTGQLESYMYEIGIKALLFLHKEWPIWQHVAVIVLGYAKAQNQYVPWCRVSGWNNFPIIHGFDRRLGEFFKSPSIKQNLEEVNSALAGGASNFQELKEDSYNTQDRTFEVAIEKHSFLHRSKLEVSIKIRDNTV